MTGKRSSGAATTNPSRSQNAGVAALVASSRGAHLWIRLDGGKAASREVVAHGLDEHRREAAVAGGRVVAMQVMVAGSGDTGRRGYSSRVRRARGYADSGPNCAYPAGSSSSRRTFAYDPKTDRPRASSRSLGGAPVPTAGAAFGAGANGLNAGSSSVANGLNACFWAGANGLISGSSSRHRRTGWASRGAGACGARRVRHPNHDARAAFEPRSASSQ